MSTILILLIPVLLCKIDCNEIQYHILEESPIDTVIGNLFKTTFPLTNQGDRLKILNKKERFVNCFKINDRGDLLVARLIDRDTICQKPVPEPTFILKSELSSSSSSEECKIALQVALQSNNMIVRIIIVIEDINDNAPRWSQNRIDLRFIDECKDRTKVIMPPAYDNDIGTNAQIEYSIKERDLPFRVNTIDGLYLETLRSLDRELKDIYKFTVTATDKGHPAKSGEIDVQVTIEDINDNSPVFGKSIYRFKAISESSVIGTVIGKLDATDADAGVNGKFQFKFENSVSSSVKHYFSVHSDGTVTVNALLDCDRGDNEHKFKVIVEDDAVRPYSRSSESTVIITINDVNDEVPEIKLIFMDIDSRSNVPFIMEHSKVNTLIGILEVTDPDFKRHDVVTCRDPPHFSLILEDRYSKYKIMTNIEFDREKTPDVTLVIVCQDGAGNIASVNQTILIKDVNDNPPTFSKSLYVVKIRENMPPGSQLSEKVVASDPDGDSLIQYSMGKEFASNFSINADTGMITTRVSFDREECNAYTIKVLATDASHGTINTGTGTVQVLILDQNDNKPVFSQDFYSFHVAENNLLPTKVGSVEATDLDTGPDQQNSLRYFLDQSLLSRHFQIDPRSGLIRATTTLDREKMTHYIFPVFVEDGQATMMSSHRYTATSTVTVVIDDVNDNAPRFLIPNATKSSFDVSIKETVGHKIAYIVAEDRDSLDNARIIYKLSAGNELSLFSIDPSSGLLFLSDSLQSSQGTHPTQRQFFLLTVTACDSGKPVPMCTDFKNLRIIIKNGLAADGSQKNSDSFADSNVNVRPNSAHQEAIIICLAIVFITLLVSSAALLVLVKCKPALWCRRSTRANSKDKRFETCVNSQMLPTIDGNVKEKDMDEAMRNFCAENQSWQTHNDHFKFGKAGKTSHAIDHTNRPDYQTLESLCLASSMRCTPQPRFVDPCSRFQDPMTMPFSVTPSFLSQQDLKRAHQSPAIINDLILTDGHSHIYQAVDEDTNTVHFYSKLNDGKKCSSKYNINEHNINPGSTGTSNTAPAEGSNKRDKYVSYTYNEASFV